MKSNSTEPSWWNKPVLGDDGLLAWGKEKKTEKAPIPSEVIDQHQKILNTLKFLSPIAQSLDSLKFKNQEFQLFVQIKFALLEGFEDYKHLNHSIILLRSAIEAKDKFLALEETEIRHRSKAQQEFYQYIFIFLSKKIDKKEFFQIVHNKLNKILPEIQTTEGKVALESYVKILDILSEQNFIGLKLFYFFKKYLFADFSSLKFIAELLVYLYNKNVQDINYLLLVVKENYEFIAPLGKVIELPNEKNQIKSYAIMLQYLALRKKHQETYIQFQRLIEILIEWHKSEQHLINLRQQYPPSDCQVPSEFTQEIPGSDLYNKYQQYIVYFLVKKDNLNSKN